MSLLLTLLVRRARETIIAFPSHGWRTLLLLKFAAYLHSSTLV